MQTISLPDLQSSLPKLAQTVLEGEWLLIPFGGKKMVLHLADDDTAPPMREQGYFEDCLDDESSAMDNLAAAHSPQTMVP
jgi:hypothetical protein